MSVPEMREYLDATMDFEPNFFDLLTQENTWRNGLVDAGIIDENKQPDANNTKDVGKIDSEKDA